VRDLVRDLALALRECVVPNLGSHAHRAHGAELAEGGDVTFKIDEEAEELLGEFLGERAPDVAYYSEDQGLVAPEGAETVLIVDPIDGTRPAMAGLESCCVSIAAAPLREGVTMGEVTIGCVVEIPSGTVFLAERGQGVVEGPEVKLSANERIDRMFWTYGFRGRPARPTVEVIGDLIDESSVGGGEFDLGSACFNMTRLLTGQLDAYVEPGPRLIEDVPETKADFERVGNGAILNNSPYDLAAAALLLTEGGAIVTDAYGRPLDDRELLGSGVGFQMSIVCSANRPLHDAIIEKIDGGIERLRVGLRPEVREPS
jgi:myo-inositol-1(or 4)-monophosphatase